MFVVPSVCCSNARDEMNMRSAGTLHGGSDEVAANPDRVLKSRDREIEVYRPCVVDDVCRLSLDQVVVILAQSEKIFREVNLVEVDAREVRTEAPVGVVLLLFIRT